jgi:hypothetical protein
LCAYSDSNTHSKSHHCTYYSRCHRRSDGSTHRGCHHCGGSTRDNGCHSSSHCGSDDCTCRDGSCDNCGPNRSRNDCGGSISCNGNHSGPNRGSDGSCDNCGGSLIRQQ